MEPLTTDDVGRWDLSAIQQVFDVATERGKNLYRLGDNLQQVGDNLSDWHGDGGDAFRQELGKARKDITADGHETAQVAAAVSRAEKDISACKTSLNDIEDTTRANNWKVTRDWKIDIGSTGAGRERDLQFINAWRTLQGDLDQLKVRAQTADHELATALRAAVGDAKLDAAGSPMTGSPMNSPVRQEPPLDPPPVPTGPVYPEAIPLDQVDYSGLGNWDSGEDAVRGYIDHALDSMGITDPVARANWMTGMLTLVGRESSFNGKSVSQQVNQWDSNAQASTYTAPDGFGNMDSRGAAQCIPPTFAANHQPGTSNSIYDPVANIAADMNHLMGAWGVSRDGSDLAAKVQQANPGEAPHGQ